MSNVKKIHATDGTILEYVDEVKGQGGLKDCFLSPNKTYVCLFFREAKHNTPANKERLEMICEKYYKSIFDQIGGDYWRHLFVWPNKVICENGMIGISSPVYPKNFYFAPDRFGGKEKEGKWFASPKLRRMLTEAERGNWLNYFHVCLKIARAVRRMHAAGLAHSDLSYRNILIDPPTGSAAIIDIDGLVVPNKFAPDVLGTPDFIAPEVLETVKLPGNDPKKKLPSRLTDLHALAVLIYMYLLYRHPLRGGKIHSSDPAEDENLSMGKNALFIEDPNDKSNRPNIKTLDPRELPYADVTKLPFTICGPYLKELFLRAFVDGLHVPAKRPSAEEWERAILKTTDLMQPCKNPKCPAHWFVFDNSTKPRCPFCGEEFHGVLPILNFYYSPRPGGNFMAENYRLMVYDKQSLYMWHVNRLISPNERISDADKKPVGDFHFHNGNWILINRRLDNLYDCSVQPKKKINIGEYIELTDGKQILLSTENGGRLALVQVVKN